MDISLFFAPIEDLEFEQTLGDSIEKNTNGELPNLENSKIALLGIAEDRFAGKNIGCANGLKTIRKHFYQLFPAQDFPEVVDLGDIKAGNEVKDTYYAITEVIKFLLDKEIVPLIIGGSQDITLPIYKAYQDLGQIVNISSVDQSFDLGENDEGISSTTFLNEIINSSPNCLFNYSNIGYQTYFVTQEQIEIMGKMYFDIHRLGEFRNNIEEIEPVIRNADIFSFDLNCLKRSDSPGNGMVSPNGFYAEEACQMARYAGMSDKLTNFGIFEYNPLFDQEETSAKLIAQMLWCFLDGFANRRKDYPVGGFSEYTKYRVEILDKYELMFLKSNKTNRWWINIPFPNNEKIKYERHHLVPCSYADYQIATQNEMPDIWWKNYQKLS